MSNDDYRDELEELYNRELVDDRRELPAGGLELVDRASSCASIVLEACNAELLERPLRRHHVRAELVDDRRELPAGGLELVDRASSCASIELEELYNRELVDDRRELPAGGLELEGVSS